MHISGMHLRHTLVPLSIALAALGAPLRAQAGGEAWQIVPQPQSSLVLARDGSLIGEIGEQFRTSVSLQTLPPYVAQAFIAVEDQRFYQHDGVDVIGLAGALKDALRGHAAGRARSRSSSSATCIPTSSTARDRSIARKLHEQKAAREMERHYDKEQILEAYLNQINLGHGWYGIEAASRHYFGNPAARLTLAEAATLAAMPKAPALYDPIAHPDRARERRNLVLTLMAEQGYITPSAADAAKAEPVRHRAERRHVAAAPYFVDAVRRRRSARDSGDERRLPDHTTIDPSLQHAADRCARVRTRARRGARATSIRRTPRATAGRATISRAPSSRSIRRPATCAHSWADATTRIRTSTARSTRCASRAPRSSRSSTRRRSRTALTANAIVPDTALAIPLDRNGVYRPEKTTDKFSGR